MRCPARRHCFPAPSRSRAGQAREADGHGWHIHQRVTEPDASTLNKVILEELEGGANGVVLQIAGPGQGAASGLPVLRTWRRRSRA